MQCHAIVLDTTDTITQSSMRWKKGKTKETKESPSAGKHNAPMHMYTGML